MTYRLTAMSPTSVEKIIEANFSTQLEAVVKACERAMENSNLEGDDFQSVLSMIRSGQKETALSDRLKNISARIDGTYFDLVEAGEEFGALSEFVKAKAVSTLAIALGMCTKGFLESIYESASTNDDHVEFCSDIERLL